MVNTENTGNKKTTSEKTKANLDKINKGQINHFAPDPKIDESTTADSGVRANKSTTAKNQGTQSKDQGSSYLSNRKSRS